MARVGTDSTDSVWRLGKRTAGTLNGTGDTGTVLLCQLISRTAQEAWLSCAHVHLDVILPLFVLVLWTCISSRINPERRCDLLVARTSLNPHGNPRERDHDPFHTWGMKTKG